MTRADGRGGTRRAGGRARFALLLLAGAVVLVAVWWKSRPSDPLKAWATLGQDDRHQVAERLVGTGVLLGMSRQDLEGHLGAPSYVHDRGATLGWYVGDPPGSGFTLDTHYLEVHLAGGRVAAAGLRVAGW